MFHNSILPYQGQPSTETVETIEYNEAGQVVKRTVKTVTKSATARPYTYGIGSPQWVATFNG